MSIDSRVVETHISTLFFVGDRVYKAKKPVRTGFLDFTDVDRRLAACQREVTLNRRLAPDIYLGVAAVTLDEVDLDHLVVMRRLPERNRLSARLDNAHVEADLLDVANQIAMFHAGAQRSPLIDDAARPDALQRLWEADVEQVSPFAHTVLDGDDIDTVARRAQEYLAGRHRLLAGRLGGQRVCDGHGDLQAEDIFILDDGPRVLDCLEFDDTLRYGDVLSDVAFLAMDLERLGHHDLGTRFLEAYRNITDDRWPRSLSDHYIAYRAHVRAKVTCLRHEQNGDPHAAEAARALHDLSLAHLESGRIRLTLVGGSPGTGKSTVSRALAERIGAKVLSSDEVRDEKFPRDTSQGDRGQDRLDRGRYEPDMVHAVYVEMMRRARLLLEDGESVVLDASWLDPSHRLLARGLAETTHSALRELRCTCPEDLARQRIRRRATAGGDASEATPAIADALAHSAAVWPEALLIDTQLSGDDAASLAERFVLGHRLRPQ